ncbi:hypothetical protein D3C80_2230200 [compost metagenome]
MSVAAISHGFILLLMVIGCCFVVAAVISFFCVLFDEDFASRKLKSMRTEIVRINGESYLALW